MSCAGVIKSFNPTKGFGFITYNDADVFAHINDCEGGTPQTGDNVMFDLEESPSKPGSYKAVKIIGGTGESQGGKGKGKGKSEGTGAMTGTVKSFSDVKAWGFILYEGQDVFFHLKDMADGTAPVTGDVLKFDLEENDVKPGSLKATNVTGGSGWPKGGKGGKDSFGAAKGGWNDWNSWGPYGGGKSMGKGWDGGKSMGKGWDGGKSNGWDGGKGMAWGGGKSMGWDSGKSMGKGWDGGKGMSWGGMGMGMGMDWNGGKGKGKFGKGW